VSAKTDDLINNCFLKVTADILGIRLSSGELDKASVSCTSHCLCTEEMASIVRMRRWEPNLFLYLITAVQLGTKIYRSLHFKQGKLRVFSWMVHVVSFPDWPRNGMTMRGMVFP